jgi:hypothetical protein
MSKTTFKLRKTTLLTERKNLRAASIVRGCYGLSLCLWLKEDAFHSHSTQYIPLDRWTTLPAGFVILPEEYQYVKIKEIDIYEDGVIQGSMVKCHIDKKKLNY